MRPFGSPSSPSAFWWRSNTFVSFYVPCLVLNILNIGRKKKSQRNDNEA